MAADGCATPAMQERLSIVTRLGPRSKAKSFHSLPIANTVPREFRSGRCLSYLSIHPSHRGGGRKKEGKGGDTQR